MSSRRRAKKKKLSKIPLIISALAVAWIIFFTAYFFRKYSPTDKLMDPAEYFQLEEADDAALIVNDEVLEEKGKVINGAVYFDYLTAWDMLNNAFYL